MASNNKIFESILSLASCQQETGVLDTENKALHQKKKSKVENFYLF